MNDKNTVDRNAGYARKIVNESIKSIDDSIENLQRAKRMLVELSAFRPGNLASVLFFIWQATNVSKVFYDIGSNTELLDKSYRKE